MEGGEDPEQIESEMGDVLGEEEPFQLSGKKGRIATGKQKAPFRDDTMYDL
jgi:hypothetical protein